MASRMAAEVHFLGATLTRRYGRQGMDRGDLHTILWAGKRQEMGEGRVFR